MRAFSSVGGEPLFFEHAEGAYMFDVDGKRYIDYIGSWGPMVCGHAHPHIIEAVQKAAAKSLSFGTPAEGEVTMAEMLCEMVPSLERVRMVNSGTEAAMSALRIARAATWRCSSNIPTKSPACSRPVSFRSSTARRISPKPSARRARR